MNCHEARQWLPHYLNGEISASERELVQTHLADCEACFDELQSLGAVQRTLRTGLQAASDRVAPSAKAWSKLHTALQSNPTPPTPQAEPQHRPAFMLRAIGAVFATLSVMVGAAVLRPAWVGNLAPSSEATTPTLAQPAQKQSSSTAAFDPDHRRLAAFLKTEPYQSVRSAIAMLADPDLHAIDQFTCPACARMQ